MSPRPVTGAAEVVAHARAHPARLGSSRLVCVDGPAGAGKTTVAGEIAGLLGAPMVRMDDLYPGWDGLFAVDAVVLALLGPLAEGRPGTYRRYDWTAGEYQEAHTVEPAPYVVLEGVGSGNRPWRELVTTLVWVEAPPETCRRRGLARDGESVRQHWLAWEQDQSRLFAQQDTRAAAHLVLHTGTEIP